MNEPESFHILVGIAVAIIGILQGLVGWFLKHTISNVEQKLDKTYYQVSQINGSIRELKVWKDEHQDRHTEFIARDLKEHEDLWRAVDLLRVNCMSELRLWAEKQG